MKLLNLIRAHTFENNIHITTSIGLTTGTFALTSYIDLIKSADESLYLSKTSGKNRIESKMLT